MPSPNDQPEVEDAPLHHETSERLLSLEDPIPQRLLVDGTVDHSDDLPPSLPRRAWVDESEPTEPEPTLAPEGETDGSGSSLRRTASRAFGWSFFNTAVSRFGTLAIGIALARLLGPTEFGTFAIATVAMMAVLSFNDLGVSLAIVRWQGDPKLIAPTINTISLASSILLVGVMCLGAGPFASAMGNSGAAGVVRLMSLSILVNGLVATPAAMLQRNFQGGRRMAVDQVNTWLGAGVSLLLAFLGFGAISLAIGRIVGSVVSGAMFFVWSPVPYRLGFDRTRAGELLRFGLPLAGASIIVFASSYADQLVAGAQLGATALGFYVLAFNLSSWPVSIFSQPLRGVAPAAFSRLQHSPEEMNRAFGTIMGLLASVALPACALLAGAATPLVLFVYKQEWAPAAGVLLWLGVLAALRICFELTYDFLVVRGRSRAIFISQMSWLVLSIPALLLGARYGGLVGIAMAQVVVAAAVMVPLYSVMLRQSGISTASTARKLALPTTVALAIGVGSHAISGAVTAPFLACVLSGLVALAGMGLLLALRRGDIASSGLLRRRG